MLGCQRALLAWLAGGLLAWVAAETLSVSASADTNPASEGEAALADTFSMLVEDYEAFRRDTNPAAAARGTGAGPVQWPSVSPQVLQTHADRARALLDRLERLGTTRDTDAAILQRLLSSVVMRQELGSERVPFTGDSGFHSAPIFAAARARIRSVADAEAYLTRLRDIPRYFDENTQNMRRGIASGWTAHGDPLSTVIDQVAEQSRSSVDTSILLAPLQGLPDGIPAADRVRIEREGREAVAAAIAAYRDVHAFLETEYAPNVRAAPGLASLRGGRRAYSRLVAHHTAGSGLSPQDIHELGVAEVARIREEMQDIIDEVGFAGDFGAFLDFLREDPRFYAASAQDLIEKAATISKRLDASLPQYFGRLPRLPYGVSPVPAAIAPGYTTGRYAQGDPETGRSGTYLVNTYRLDQRPLYELPALTAHEAVPGHHLQIALAQEMRGVPEFRRTFYATAFGEGWALYAERLAGEAGIYTTPYERFGALSYEMWRACRLVSDTGLHWYGWSRARAEACFRENTALSPLNIQTEVTRYIGWPGQAVAYKVGELKIRQLRQEAEAALGSAFDLRAFHDHLLAEGSMPLSTLQTRMRTWIADQSAEASNALQSYTP
ncbi:MAG: DUF885 domain-containing protein [Pseudomonadota bacterium]